MSLVFGFHKQVYDDVKPLYIDLGHNKVVNRLKFKLLDKDSLLAEMTAESYTPGAHEIGAGGAWLDVHKGPWSAWAAETIAVAAITPTIAGLPAAAAGGQATVQIQTQGKETDAAAVATVTVAFGAGDVTFTVNIPAGEQGAGILRDIAAAPEWATNDLTAAVAGAKMTVTNNNATDALTKLTVTLA